MSVAPLACLYCCLLVSLGNFGLTNSQKHREYYIGAVEIEWDYAPSSNNLITGESLMNDSASRVFVENSENRIGKTYKKAVYRQYTDGTFSARAEHSEAAGLLGPLLHAEVGDTVTVHFSNMASRPYSVHPHGVFYEKNSEGALYNDNTQNENKADDEVHPGETYKYMWEVPERAGPTSSDPNCLPWAYHSHVESPRDTNSGLVGLIIVCRQGILDGEGKRKDVDREWPLLFTVIDENLSWYLQDNIDEYCSDQDLDPEDADFQESNLMHGINGYLYGNLPDLYACADDRIAWYLFGLGTEVDVHTAFFHGNTLEQSHHRTDAIGVYPAAFIEAEMTASNWGTWLINCMVNDHYDAGMLALYHVYNDDISCGELERDTDDAEVVREYFIAAEEVYWNFAPSGLNQFDGDSPVKLNESEDAAVFFERGQDRIGGTYKKVVYAEYTDATFGTAVTRSGADLHLGSLGPVIKGEVGDVIKVLFFNRAGRSYSILPHGVLYNKTNEGAGVDKSDDSVSPGEKRTYRWSVPESSGPSQSETTDCITWIYSSAVDTVRDTNSGLIGPLLTCRPGTLDGQGNQVGIDQSFYLLFSVTDENLSWYIDENIQEFCADPSSVDPEDEDFQESNLMHGINGYLYGNLVGLEMCMGSQVSWHLISVGTEVDIHTASFNGQTVMYHGNHQDTINLEPGLFKTAIMTPDNLGTWSITCRTNDHYVAGMKATFRVDECGTSASSTQEEEQRTIREYFIAAVEVEWDYCENSYDYIKGEFLEEDKDGYIFVARTETLIGSAYKKVVYREYTDNSFANEKTRTQTDNHLGILGPVIKAEVGDEVRVYFKNLASRQYSIHAHGVKTDKDSEGAKYIDGREESSVNGNGVAPGETYQYLWSVPERSGPDADDLTGCATWAYYSSVDPVKDTNSGLVGPLVVCRKGLLTGSDQTPSGVDRDFALLFTVFDENLSWYLDENIRTYCSEPGNVDLADEEFVESNLMHSINGYIYGHVPDLTMAEGDVVYWHVMGLGTEVDMHPAHFHAHTFQHSQDLGPRQLDVYNLFPGTFATLRMKVDVPGTWLVHCHVNDHMAAGMEALYTVNGETTEAARLGQTVEILLLAASFTFWQLTIL